MEEDKDFILRRIVKTLLQGLENTKINSAMDYWYASISLVDYLDDNGIKTTGTVKKKLISLQKFECSYQLD